MTKGANPVGISSVKVLFVGKSQKAGSWKIRGEQIAACRSNWKSTLMVAPQDFFKYDIFCFVKHVDRRILNWARRFRKICVYDIIDSWPQPEAYRTCPDRSAAVQLFTEKWKTLCFDGWIFPNKTMASHLAGLTQNPVVIYHHYLPGIRTNPIRKKIKKIGYEGNSAYLGPWQGIFEKICAEKGMEFVINPEHLADVDVVVAARGGEHSGFLSGAYKSNVKLANAYGSGTPCVAGSPEFSYHETDCGSVLFFDSELQLRAHLSALESHQKRLSIQRDFLKARESFAIDKIADSYEIYFQNLVTLRKGRTE